MPLGRKKSIKEQGNEWLISSYEPQDFGVTDPDEIAWTNAITDPDEIAWTNARLGPMPWHTHDQHLKMQNTESKKLVKSYISYCKRHAIFVITHSPPVHGFPMIILCCRH